MCGIVGALHLDHGSIDPHTVQRAAHVLRHRGPDGEGYLLMHTASGRHSLRNGPDTPPGISYPPLDAPADFAPDLVFGHRRLAILDLSPGGHEPMTLPGEQFWVTFNGEIYNYLELRDELMSLGYGFHTESDVEVLLRAYEAWGIDCLSRLVGMFAFALWDQPRRRLWCARDHVGIKPLYYAVAGGQFAFASEIKALRILTPDACTPDKAQLAWFLHYGLVYHAPRTFYEGVRELPGGHYVLVQDGRVGEPVRWWDVDLARARATYDYGNVEGEFLRLMRDSVKLQLRSDVPVGTCLSGGLDSSTIVALATEQLSDGRMNSFSSLYPVKGLDERRYVDIVSARFNTIRHETTPGPENYLARLERIAWHQDVPTSTPTVYSQANVMELAHGKVTVLLDGQGADELFAGYLSYVVAHLSELRRRDPRRWLGEQVAFMLDVWPRFFAAMNWREFAARAGRFMLVGRKPLRFLRPDLVALAEARHAELPRPDLPGADPLNQVLYRTVVVESIPTLLQYEDRNSMAYSIEARVPFLDHRLIEFVLGVPGDLKIRGPETKWFMRRALRDVLPKEVTGRKDKLGYPTPFSQWLRGPLGDEISAYLEDTAFRRDWYDVATLRALWAAHRSGATDHGNLIHRLVAVEMWGGIGNVA